MFLPHKRGFQYYLGLPYSVDMGTSVWWPDDPSHPSGWGYPLLPAPLLEATDTAVGSGYRIIEQPALLQNLTARYTARAEQFIHDSTRTPQHSATGTARINSTSNSTNNSTNINGGDNDDGDGDLAAAPWVLFMSYNHVHNPQFCSKPWCNTSTVLGTGDAVKSGHGWTGSAIQEMDWSVSRIMAALKQAGCDDNTLTFFTSDNGSPSNHVLHQDAHGSNAPLSGFKGQILEGGIRMPAMARWPGKIRPGSTSAELVATYDIFTTMLSLAGAQLPQNRVIDGIDISPILFESDGAAGHDCLFQYYTGLLLAAVRYGPYGVSFFLSLFLLLPLLLLFGGCITL